MSDPWIPSRGPDALARDGLAAAGAGPGSARAMASPARTGAAFDALPADLRGRSVLDLGCGAGQRCFEAARRGARRVVGIEVDPAAVGAARREARRTGLPVEVAHADAEQAALDGAFDHVLCLGVLEWARDPLRLLARLVDHTAERLVIEVSDPAARAGEGRWASLQRSLLARAPVLTVGRSASSHRFQDVPRFVFAYGALENLLFYQRGVFARFGRLPAPPGRLRVAAERRRIDELVLVAGPSGCGKSTLIAALQAGRAPALAARLGLGDGSRWPMLSAFDMVEQQEPHVERALFHYDTLRPFLRSSHVHARERALEVLATARHSRVLTIWTPPQVLRERFEREGKLERKSRGKRRLRAIHALFGDPDRVVAHYREWFAFCAERGLEVLVVSPLEDLRCTSVGEWERDHAS